MWTDYLRRRSGPVILAVLVGIGLALAIWRPIGLQELLQLGHGLADHPLALLLIVVAMAVLFTFALPGSLGFWLVAPFQPLVLATALLVLASVAGGLGGYWFSRYLGTGRPPGRQGRRIRRLLARRGDFLTLSAMRIFPGFPHSVINYASGVAHVPLQRFIASAVAGLTIKFGVYTSAVQAGVHAIEDNGDLDPRVVLPLVALALLMLGGVWLRGLLRHTDAD